MKLTQKLIDWIAGKRVKWFRGKDRLISVTVAKKIQQKAYEHALKYRISSDVPTYKHIVSGLNDKHEQIFQATVYNLVQIAHNVPLYRDEIYRLLQEKIASRNLPIKYKQYLQQKLDLLSKRGK